MIGETLWNAAYEKYIWKIRENRIARNVMIHKLLDMLDVLQNPANTKMSPVPNTMSFPGRSIG